MKKFAFLIHPRMSARDDMAKVFWPLKIVPEGVVRWGMQFLPPIPRGKVRFSADKEVMGWLVVVPLAGPQMLSLPRDVVTRKIIQAVQVAEKLGAEVVGLGELTSSITHGGKDLIGKVNASVTNGNALTAGISFEAVKKACPSLRGTRLSNQKVAVLGATGSVGTAISFLLAEEGSSLLLLARGRGGLEKLAKEITLRHPQCQVRVTQGIEDVRDAGVVIVVTSGVKQVLGKNHLDDNALVYDITQPRNTSPSLLAERPDITILDGGVISTPGINYGMDIGLNNGQAYACLAETMLLALAGRNGNYVGNATAEQAKEMLMLMEEYRCYFQLAPFQTFGVPLQESSISVGAPKFPLIPKMETPIVG